VLADLARITARAADEQATARWALESLRRREGTPLVPDFPWPRAPIVLRALAQVLASGEEALIEHVAVTAALLGAGPFAEADAAAAGRRRAALQRALGADDPARRRAAEVARDRLEATRER